MDAEKSENDNELTSTMDSLMSTNKDEKGDASDSMPTSSTDAFTTASSSQLATEDQISSTSSDVVDSKKSDKSPFSISSSNMPLLPPTKTVHGSSFVSEKDLLVMNITDTSAEKITEDVEDIVQDLENLLGEPTTSFDFPVRPKQVKSHLGGTNSPLDFDKLTAEFQVVAEEPPKQTIQEEITPETEAEQFNPETPSDLTELTKEPPLESHLINSNSDLDVKKGDEKLEPVPLLDNAGETNIVEQIEAEETTPNEKQECGDVAEEVAIEPAIIHPERNEELTSSDITSTNVDVKMAKSDESSGNDGDVLVAEEETENVDPTPMGKEVKEQDLDKATEEIHPQEPRNEAEPAASEVVPMETDGLEVDSVSEIKTKDAEESMECEEIPPENPTPVVEVNAEADLPETPQVLHEKTDEPVVALSPPKEVDEITDDAVNETSVAQDQSQMVSPVETQSLTHELESVSIESQSQLAMSVASKGLKASPQGSTSEVEINVQEVENHLVKEENAEVKESSEVLTAEVLSEANVEKTEESVGIEKSVNINVPGVEDAEIKEPLEVETVEVLSEANAGKIEESVSIEKAVDIIVRGVEDAEMNEAPEVETLEVLSEANAEKIEESVSIEKSVDIIVPGVEDAEIKEPPEVETVEVLPEANAEKVEESVSIEKAVDINVRGVEDTEMNEALEVEMVEVLPEANAKKIEESVRIEKAVDIIVRGVEDAEMNEPPEVETAKVLSEANAEKVEESVSIEKAVYINVRGVEDAEEEETVEVLPENKIEKVVEESNGADVGIEKVDVIEELPIHAATNVKEVALEQTELPTTTERQAKDLAEVSESRTSEISEIDQEVIDQVDEISNVQHEDATEEEVKTVESFEATAIAEQKEPEEEIVPELATKTPEDVEVLNAVSALMNETGMESEPLVFDIPATEESAPSKIPPQDDNMETLLAVASLQDDYVPEPEIIETAVEVTKEPELKKEETGDKLTEPLLIKIDEGEKERHHNSPKIKIKPIKPPKEEIQSTSSESDEAESTKCSLKMTITKQSDNMHSILKIYDPSDDSVAENQQEHTIPKLIIKSIQSSEQHSPKSKNKQVFSPTSGQRSSSPRITIKPIIKPPEEAVTPLKITIKPVLKSEEIHRQKHSPKLTIKPVVKPEEEGVECKVISPRVTIKPIKPPEDVEQASSPRITIKPIVKPVEEPTTTTPKVTIKPIVKPQEKNHEEPEKSSPKITIKPIVKPQEQEQEDFEESIKERIVLKINKGNIPVKECRKREAPPHEEEKLAKIKLKFSKEGGHAQIVQNEDSPKRSLEILETERQHKRIKLDECATSASHSKLKEMLGSGSHSKFSDRIVTIEDEEDDSMTAVENIVNKDSPIVISEESNQDSISVIIDRDPLAEIPVFEITPVSVKTLNLQETSEAAAAVVPEVAAPAPTPPTPRKRGRPRKVPLQVREEFKDPKEEEPKPVVYESTRPKRSCRGPSVRTTLGIKPRKPRGPGRGRGGKRGMGTRSTPTRTPTPTPPSPPPRPAKEPRLSASKLRQMKEDLSTLSGRSDVKAIEIDDGFPKSPLAPPCEVSDRADIVMYEEETRMSAETNSRAQTPAKQVVTTVPTQVDLIEESQSSVQSTATTESAKARKGPRLEVQEPEGAVISADQLAEYYWMSGGPFMLQEQVAQFLGIKSFKRKYPNIQRRVVDMQERDFIRESGLAGEAMCDLGLTAVNSADILDIMYSDFQDKYEEYCKHQRDRQAKDLTNKQKALSLAASQEKNKIDITQQAVQSAASWNATFNKTRKDQRKACMDLQTLTVHYPKGKMKQLNKPKLGSYPVALVPGQYTDFYKDFTPTEINNLPLNTLCYDPVIKEVLADMECDSQTDGSGSDSDTSTSDSDSSYSGSSDPENCSLCKPSFKRVTAAQ